MTQEKMEKIWEQLHESRRLEVQNIWTRSVFLAAFITLALTGYGVFFGMVFLENGKWQTVCNGSPVHLVGLFLGVTILLLGFLWIAMAKGSKYWSEIYEQKINLLEMQYLNNFDERQFRYLEENKILCPNEEMLENGNHLIPDGGCLSLKASPRSPSRINIILGIFMMIIGSCIVLWHTGMLMGYTIFTFWNLSLIPGVVFLIMTFILLIIFAYCIMHCIWKALEHRVNATTRNCFFKTEIHYANINALCVDHGRVPSQNSRNAGEDETQRDIEIQDEDGVRNETANNGKEKGKDSVGKNAQNQTKSSQTNDDKLNETSSEDKDKSHTDNKGDS